ncbi:MAG: InlB B-repeat-containing protein, partial [Kiritimatiellae bacterium]|nr:InlB B-repeat-containing protein [Kiritimatiellia bacterium]
GYVFNGWWTAKSGGTKVTADDVAIGDATYYAHWKLPTYSVFFHANGGTGGKTFTVTKGSTLGAYMDQVSPKRDGYTFNGWWTAKTGGTKVPASTVVNAGVTYYAHWK